jgi:four helix bundle protein
MNEELDNRKAFKLGFKKRCFDFSLAILRLAGECREKRENWILIDQLVRSGTSIGANIVEGGNSTSKREFINYFQISLKSASETVYWLELLKEINTDKKDQIEHLIDECIQIKKIISTIILNTKDNSRL